jgi:hypothetical protein
MRASREEWAKRVERWRESGLSAEQYASKLGINCQRSPSWIHRRSAKWIHAVRRSGERRP